jgi:hypothetical protein
MNEEKIHIELLFNLIETKNQSLETLSKSSICAQSARGGMDALNWLKETVCQNLESLRG